MVRVLCYFTTRGEILTGGDEIQGESKWMCKYFRDEFTHRSKERSSYKLYKEFVFHPFLFLPNEFIILKMEEILGPYLVYAFGMRSVYQYTKTRLKFTILNIWNTVGFKRKKYIFDQNLSSLVM